MRKNYIIFFVLSFLIIIGSTMLFPPSKERKKQPPSTATPAPGAATTAPSGATPPAPPPPAAEAPPLAPPIEGGGHTIKVRSPLYEAEFDTLGGTLRSWKLVRYRLSTTPDSPPVDVLHDTPRAAELVLAARGIDVPRPIPFAYDGPDTLELSDGTAEITFHWSPPDGTIEVKKTYVLDPHSYVVTLRLEVINRGGNRLPLGLTLEWYAQMKHGKKRDEFNRQFIALVGDELFTEQKTPKETKTLRGVTSWLGFSDKYFMGAYVPEVGSPATVTLIPTGTDSLVLARFAYPGDVVPAGGRSMRISRLFLGPKDLDILKQAGSGLDRAIKYGWMGFLAKPMLAVLKVIYSWVHNYGLAIIVITFLIRLIFLPLTIKSMESMKLMQEKMKALKPKIDEIKKKYKDDKTRENQELMKLYTSHGINPLSSLGGCLPLLVQIPVFIALYEVLLYSIELRHSSFLWIDNLAEAEQLFNIPHIGVPFRILPLLMGVSWYVSQKLTPTSAPGQDAAQMKIMEYMPIIFTVMFWGLPSGLILYWTVSNLLSIAQQLYVNHRLTKQGRA